MTEYEMVDEPPPGKGDKGKWWSEEFLAHCQAHSGKWFVAPKLFTAGTAGTHAANFKKKGFDATTRVDYLIEDRFNARIYVRWPER